MPSGRSFTVALLAALCAASMLASGALAAPPGPSIKSVDVYSTGISSQTGLCSFNAAVTYKHKLGTVDRLRIVLRRDGEHINSNLELFDVTSRSPTIWITTGPELSPGSSFDFIVSLEDERLEPVSSATTSPFVGAGVCPAAGTLVSSYPFR